MTASITLLLLASLAQPVPATHDAKLAKLRETFDKTVRENRSKAAATFERALKSIRDASTEVIPADQRDQLVSDLTSQVTDFATSGKITAGLAGHEFAKTYLSNVRTAARTFAARAKDLAGGAKPGTPAAVSVESAGDGVYDEVNGLDLFQPGTVWDGVRRDRAPPPNVVKQVNPFNVRHSRWWVQMPGGWQAKWDMFVLSRKRDRVRLRAEQENGKDKWELDGTFDGTDLRVSNAHLPNLGMLEGALPRAFDYAGLIVGSSGGLDFKGITAQRTPTNGWIRLELRK